MTTLIIIILSIIQGATEFLPISSSGHLVLFYRIFNIEENTILLSVILHLATLFSIVWVYKKELWSLIKKPFCNTTYMLIISTIASLIIVIILMPFVEKSFSGEALTYCFMITAVILVLGENLRIKQAQHKIISNSNLSYQTYLKNDINFNNSFFSDLPNLKQSLMMGIGQGLACFPGISRSGTTIATGLVFGANKDGVANYSFLMSLPIILASLIFEIYKYIKNPTSLIFNTWQMLLGFLIAFLVGVLCIKLMLKFVKKQKLTIFAFYLLILSLFLILNDNLLFWF